MEEKIKKIVKCIRIEPESTYKSDYWEQELKDVFKNEIQKMIDKLEYRKSKWSSKKDKQTIGYKDGLQTAIDLIRTEL